MVHAYYKISWQNLGMRCIFIMWKKQGQYGYDPLYKNECMHMHIHTYKYKHEMYRKSLENAHQAILFLEKVVGLIRAGTAAVCKMGILFFTL